ncbi:flagellar hook-associated protein FlgL [Luteimonas sp. A478]
MSHRISTPMLYQRSISTLQSKQAGLSQLQQQMATGSKLLTAKDDPVAAGAAVALDRALAELERFGSNGDAIRHRLGLQENALTQAGDAMGRIATLTVQANSGTLSDGDRRAIAIEVESLRGTLMDLANTPDGAGRYLFGGTRDASPPFARSAGSVAYSGDQTRRSVEVGPHMFVQDTLPGSEAFMRVRTGDGRINAAAALGNAGSGTVSGFGLVDSNQWSGSSYSIVFAADGAYSVEDHLGTVVASGTHTPSDAIAFDGVQVVIEGTPAAGDAFTAGPAGTRDIFATIDRLLDALAMDPTTSAQRAGQQNALQASMRDISTAQEHLIDVRAAGGASLAMLDQADDLRSAHGLTIESTLSDLRDLDYAEAFSRFELEMMALEAAQLSFMQMQRLSLFNLIR